jgi:hypothetical protein
MPVATVVGGTPKLFTMPLNATGKDATLKDIIIWPSPMAIIGTQDSRDAAVTVALALDADSADIAFLPSYHFIHRRIISA